MANNPTWLRPKTFQTDERVRRHFETNVRPASTDADACWVWQRRKNANGYGLTKIKGVPLLAHRVAYQLYVGELIPGLLVCHRCNNQSCVRPSHLYQATNKENIAHAARDGIQYQLKKRCCPKCGGPYTYEYINARRCKPCHLKGLAELYKRRKNMVKTAKDETEDGK
jgi:hypothetical protein